VEKAVVDLAVENPALGQLRASHELQRKRKAYTAVHITE
jgi:hypothetical protein